MPQLFSSTSVPTNHSLIVPSLKIKSVCFEEITATRVKTPKPVMSLSPSKTVSVPRKRSMIEGRRKDQSSLFRDKEQRTQLRINALGSSTDEVDLYSSKTKKDKTARRKKFLLRQRDYTHKYHNPEKSPEFESRRRRFP